MTGPVTSPDKGGKGFTLVELLTVVAVIGIVSAVAVPAVRTYYDKCCVMAAVTEITGMIKEGKQNALCDNNYYGVGFDPAHGKVSLLADRGPDGSWNTGDEQVVRSFRLADKGGGLRFSSGGHGPVESGLAEPADGVSFLNNKTIICNDRLTGSAGAVYMISGSGVAMAISVNSTDAGYKLYRWKGGGWERM